MTLKKVTLYTIIGLIYIFASRTLATIYPGVFQNIVHVRINMIISFVAVLTPIFFLYYFARDYVTKSQTGLKKGAKLALFGSILIALLFLKSVLKVFDIMYQESHFLDIIIPLLNVIFLIYFFCIFFKEVSSRNRSTLRSSIIIVIIGLILLLIMHLIILFNYLYASKFTWFSDYARTMPYLVLPIIVFSFFARLNFLIVFYRRQ